MNLQSIILFVVGMVTLGCSSGPSENIPEAQTVVAVYEGLPHPFYENELYESEKNSKTTTNLHESYFYHESHSLSPREGEALQKVLGDTENFEPFVDSENTKTCGGFHADYAATWKRNGMVVEVLVCFGCDEVKRFGPEGEVREVMKEGTSDKLKTLLKVYDKIRPPHEGWGP